MTQLTIEMALKYVLVYYKCFQYIQQHTPAFFKDQAYTVKPSE